VNEGPPIHTIFNDFPWPLALLDTHGRLIHVNEAWARGDDRVLSMSPPVPGPGDDLAAHFDASPDEQVRRLANVVRAVVAGERHQAEGSVVLEDHESRLLATAGDWRDDGETRTLLVMRRSQRDHRHRAVFMASPVGIALLDARGRTLEINPALESLLAGTEGAPSAGAPTTEDRPEDRAHVHPPEHTGVLGALDPAERLHALAALERLCAGEGSGWVRETRLLRADQTGVAVRMHVSASSSGEGVPLAVVLVEDISERKRLEQQLSQAQRIESVGRLAGGIAHDFNNLVTIIRGHTELLLDEMGPDDVLRPDLEDIQRAGERAASLTGQLLAFSRRNVLQPRVLDLNTVVRDMEAILRRTLGEDMSLEVDLADDLGAVRADPGQMEQVLLNLAVNARDAMPRGGQLGIHTFERVLDHTFVAGHLGSAPGPHVIIQVRDTGHGMDETTLSRIFEPFFTTKPPGKGTGLGLAMSYGIVKQSGGYIGVESEPGRGATFTIYLPRVDRKAGSDDTVREPRRRVHGSETVLVVEDEAPLRQLAVRILTGRGYTVLDAASGNDALATARAHPKRIDLLLTDVVMPGMGGRELAERLVAEMPSVRVLYTSGYTDDDIVRYGVTEGDAPFLPKPFTPDELAAAVRKALDG
jgi:signal transduction histidine kinase/CheY-like chemotaxis protein